MKVENDSSVARFMGEGLPELRLQSSSVIDEMDAGDDHLAAEEGVPRPSYLHHPTVLQLSLSDVCP
jgi:hypothetical protein